jgi:hypothetical protein
LTENVLFVESKDELLITLPIREHHVAGQPRRK